METKIKLSIIIPPVIYRSRQVQLIFPGFNIEQIIEYRATFLR